LARRGRAGCPLAHLARSPSRPWSKLCRYLGQVLTACRGGAARFTTWDSGRRGEGGGGGRGGERARCAPSAGP
jgi:hypothetical protein